MEKKVRGILLLEYVRMMRNRKDIDWKQLLPSGDMIYLQQRILESEWYPIESFERMGLAMLDKIAGGNLDAARFWGRVSFEDIFNGNRSLVCRDDPHESVMRFQVYRRNLFNFNAIVVHLLSTDYANIEINYDMGKAGEECTTYQAIGFFEGILELSGATNIEHKFLSKRWVGASSTLIEMHWGKDTAKKKVKGILFVDYIRMLKTRKDADWSKYLKPEDMVFLKQRIYDFDWYPFDTFERLGVAILKEIAKDDVETVRVWGKFTIDHLLKTQRSLVCEGDPMESLMRFQVLRRSLFDFGAIYLESITEDFALFEISYGMCEIAEEAATYQALGFFERLLELAGAKSVQYVFKSKQWKGDPTTVLELTWTI